MGLLDKVNKQVREIEKQTSESYFADTVSNITNEFVDKLSGKDIVEEKKIIDNLIVFTGAAGGVGTSTIINNVAYQAVKEKLKVLVIDLNIMNPVQHLYLNIEQKVEKNDLVALLLGKCSLADAVDTTGSINLLYANNRTLADLINCNSNIAIENFKQVLKRIRRVYDVILIDCPLRLDDMLCNVALYNCDSIYLVWSDGIESIVNTERIRKNMNLTGIESVSKMRVVLNKRTSVRYNEYPFNKLNIELVEVLPFDDDIIESSLNGQIFCEKGESTSDNATIFAERIVTLTDKILDIGGRK